MTEPRLWVLTILLQGEPTATNLQFKTERAARAAYEATWPPAPDLHRAGFVEMPTGPTRIGITDDFGRTFAYAPSLFAKALLCDAVLAMSGDQEVQLLAARSNAALQTRALHDPAMKEAQREINRAQMPGGGLAIPTMGGRMT